MRFCECDANNHVDGKKCNVCGRTYDQSFSRCPEDGERLVFEDPLIGQMLDGRYRIEGVLGRGGMGVVYRATHIHIDKRFAVKILNPQLVADQAAIERFRREAKAAGRINHPNAIRVTDFGVTEERIVYLVMELVDGQTLSKLLSKEGPLDCHRAVSLMVQVCAAVEAAHQGGVIHRDLKPDNIIVNQAGASEEVKVTDFGIAKLRERSPSTRAHTLSDETQPSLYLTITEAGTIIGTPQYMSPEQCRATTLDSRSDVYSLGVILYEMISGQGLFLGGTLIDVLMKQIGESPRPLSELVRTVPRSLEQCVMRALEKDPDRRQASAAEFGAELIQALEADAESRRGPGTTITQRTPGTIIIESPFEGELRGRADNRTKVIDSKRQSSPTGAVAPSHHRNRVVASIGFFLLAGLIAGAVYWFSPAKPVIADEMVFIQGGTFKMGREDGEEDERPVHEERVSDFYLDRYEVTNEQYKNFVDQAPHTPPPYWKNNIYAPREAKLPVTHVSWFDADQYAKWSGKRLPTEAEWEYAARNGSKQNLYPWGDRWQPDLTAVGIPDMTKPFPVGSFAGDKNDFGVYDLAGNVCEWVNDNYHSYDNPKVYETKIFRGGSFAERDTPAEKITSTYRWYVPADPESKYKPKIGFRCAKDAR